MNEKSFWKRKSFWGMCFIVIIFVSSMIGYAMTMTPDSLTNNGASSGGKGLKAYRTKEGMIYCNQVGTEKLCYSDDYSVNPDESMKAAGEKLKSMGSVNVHAGNHTDSMFILRKFFNAVGKDFSVVSEKSCNSNSIVLSEEKLDGDCINLYGNSSEVYKDTEKLIFYYIN